MGSRVLPPPVQSTNNNPPGPRAERNVPLGSAPMAAAKSSPAAPAEGEAEGAGAATAAVATLPGPSPPRREPSRWRRRARAVAVRSAGEPRDESEDRGEEERVMAKEATATKVSKGTREE